MYGGFEAFLENCAPTIAGLGHSVQVTCDGNLYDDKSSDYRGVKRIFLSIPANGSWSLIHDFFAFIKTFRSSSHVVVLGISGGFWFPIFRLLCDITGTRLLVNVDGVEWQRTKFTKGKRWLLKLMDYFAQSFAHTVIYDNEGLSPYLLDKVKKKSCCIGYSGDHVIRLNEFQILPGTALTICRIEPENNLEMLIHGALLSGLSKYTIVGNWNNSIFGMELRKKYSTEERLLLLDPIYDKSRLAQLRESCGMYIHGHSVGGTNPSLVEMLFYGSPILCFDVNFNRHTARDSASYFKDAISLSKLIDLPPVVCLESRKQMHREFTSATISNKYLATMMKSTCDFKSET
jgi:glycosyltransferase involved in cell wall biosynthesis